MQFRLQDLPKWCARLCLKIEKTLLFNIDNIYNKTFLLSLSGGADSTALALIFHILAPRHNIKLFAFHLNHNLRPEANEDENFTKFLCKQLNIPLIIESVDINLSAQELNCGIEEAGRIIRYQYLKENMLQCKAEFIALGHQLNDLGEDILMRLIRGTGWPALGGMKVHTGNIIRPLLYTNKDKLKKFLRSINIEWREDRSNYDLAYRRNRVRRTIMPLLVKENPLIEKSFENLSHMALLDEEFWETYLTNLLAENPWQIIKKPRSTELILSSGLLAKIHGSAKLRLIKKALAYLGSITGRQINPRAETLFKIIQLLQKKCAQKCLQLSQGLEIYVYKGQVRIYSPHV